MDPRTIRGLALQGGRGELRPASGLDLSSDCGARVRPNGRGGAAVLLLSAEEIDNSLRSTKYHFVYA